MRYDFTLSHLAYLTMYFISYNYCHIPDAADWESASLLLDDLYAERPPQADFLAWRDLRALEEAHWYG